VQELKSTLHLGKSIAKNIALGNGLIASAAQRRRARKGYDLEKDQPEYSLTVFHQHSTALAPLRHGCLMGADVLEIGPGSNLGVGLLMLLAGAKSFTCLDVVPSAPDKAPEALYPALVAMAARFPDTYLVAPTLLERARQDPGGLAHALLDRISYRSPEDIGATTLPDASQDFIFSHSCFEHFADPAGAIAQIARLLRPDGVTSHQIDLRDHRNFDRPFDFLAYSELAWRMATSHAPHRVRNRWRASEYRAGFVKQGLEIVYVEVFHHLSVTKEQRRHFYQRFQAMALNDLGILIMLLVARKRG